MDYREVRIGNWVNEQGLELRVGMINSEVLESAEPIPLTEEWLVRFGFKPSEAKTAKKYIYYSDSYNFRNAKVVCKNGYDARVVIAGMVIKTKHVHQLQNLYFALTGEELEYD